MTGFDLPCPAYGTQAPAQRADVYLEVGATPAQVVSVRVVVAALAARADFDLDAVADLRMAVDEACATLAALALTDAQLQCLLQIDAERITVTVRVSPSASLTIPQDTFGWRVLMTLTDEVEAFGDGSCGVGIRLVKVRRVGKA